MVIHSPKGSKLKVNFIQCSNCGAVVGAMDYYAVGALVESTKNTLDEIARKVNRIYNSIG